MKRIAPASSLASNDWVVVGPSGMMAVRTHGPAGRRAFRKRIALVVSAFGSVARSSSIDRFRLEAVHDGVGLGPTPEVALDLHRIAAHAPVVAAAVAKRLVGAFGFGRDWKDHPAAAFDIAESFCQHGHLGGPIGFILRALMVQSSATAKWATSS